MTSVLVTGTSSGIGLACARAMSARGWTVFATMRDLGRRGALDAAVAGTSGTTEVVQLDVTDEASVRAGVATVLERTGGRLDAVVHNAGVPAAGFFATAGTGALRETIGTNLFGTATLTEALLPAMREAGRGRIVVVSSVAAFVASPGLSAYTASKWALEGWCESLAIELAPLGIDVALVEPGAFETKIWERHVAEPTDELYGRWTAAMRRRAGARPRRGDPAVVAEHIAAIVAAPRPRFRNPVGLDAWLLWGASKVVPYPVRARIVSVVSGAPRAGGPAGGAGPAAPAGPASGAGPAGPARRAGPGGAVSGTEEAGGAGGVSGAGWARSSGGGAGVGRRGSAGGAGSAGGSGWVDGGPGRQGRRGAQGGRWGWQRRGAAGTSGAGSAGEVAGAGEAAEGPPP